jgi:rhomboid protease GluP
MRIARAPVTIVLSVVMVAVYVNEMFAVAGTGREQAIIDLGAIVPGTLQHSSEWSRLFMAIFLHASVLHLLLNLWALFQLGYAFELLFGSARFMTVFVGGGLCASIASAAFIDPHTTASLGASGAIFAIAAAFTVLLMRRSEWRGAPWTRRLAQQLAIWAVITVAIGFFYPHIDNAAHVGGLLAGSILGLLFA